MNLEEFSFNIFSDLHDWEEDGFVMEAVGKNCEGNPAMRISVGGRWFEVSVKEVDNNS